MLESMTSVVKDMLERELPIMLVALVLITLAMIIDLWTGVLKAKQKHIARTSKGFRRTCQKAKEYYIPFLALTLADFLLGFLEFYSLPFFSMAYCLYTIFIEWKSIMENTRSKEDCDHIYKALLELAKNFDNKKELIEAMEKVLTEEKEKDKEE